MSASSAQSGLPGRPVYVVDAWPVLEMIYRQEPGRGQFLERLARAERKEIRLLVSRINRGEILYNVLGKHRLGPSAGDVSLDLDDLPWEQVSIDDALVDEAARLKARYPLSYADCFVAALALRHDAPVVTGDADFKKLADLGLLRLDWVGA